MDGSYLPLLRRELQQEQRVSYSKLPTACAGPTPHSHTSCENAHEEQKVTIKSTPCGASAWPAVDFSNDSRLESLADGGNKI